MNGRKRVLIIAYYWPPAGGGGVQRWLKFAKYLPEFGWDPIMFVPENADYPEKDPSLEKDISPGLKVLKRPIWEPYSLFKIITGNKTRTASENALHRSKKELSFTEKLSIWVRGNFFIPDARRFWINPSVKYLASWIKANPVDLIITTGTPHSLHLIGLKLTKRLNIPWVADFRDPWTNIEFYKELRLSNWADKVHHKLEKRVLTESAGVITVSWRWAEEFKVIGTSNIVVITNGYDAEDFEHEPPEISKKFKISHIGTFAKDRDPETLWKVLRDLCQEDPVFESSLSIQLVGRTDDMVLASVGNHNLSSYLETARYIEHEKAILEMESSSLLLLLINKDIENAGGRIAGKVFEYLASRRPILCLSPIKGDSAQIIKETNGGTVLDYEDYSGIRSVILNHYHLFLSGNKQSENSNFEQYSRRNLSKKLAKFLQETTQTSRIR